MKLKFAKMHGLGNDFAVIDAINQEFKPRPGLVREWADRFNGIGFDQMLIVERPTTDRAAFRYRIYNADGGEVEQCGNGARCFARFVREQGLTDLDLIPVETNTGLLKIDAIDATRYRVDMGVPRFEPAEIPLRAETRQALYSTEFNGTEISFSAISIGNPHMVIQVPDVDAARIETIGPYFESHMMFPERANIGFMQVVDRETFKLRVYERGVGETRACGSGACAAAVAAARRGLTGRKVEVVLTGGSLILNWRDDGHVEMTGPVATAFTGELPQ